MSGRKPAGINRRILLSGLTTAAGACLRARQRLNVYNWSDYIATDTIAGFEREFDATVRYGTYESTEEMLAKAITGNSGWDVVFPANSYVGPMCELDLLTPLEARRLPHLESLDGPFRNPPWDQELRWSVPYMYGATGILVGPAAPAGVTGWSSLWDARLGGRMTMMDDASEVFAACLKRLGWSVNAAEPGRLEAAKHAATAQKPLLRAYLNAEVRDQVVAGDVWAAQAWTVTAQQAIDGNAALRFVFPAEGFPLYADCCVILRESKRVELAHRFINYLLRPAIAARIASQMRTATANGDARKLLSAADRENPVLYPPAEVLARGEWFRPLAPATQRLRDRLWTEIKAA